MSDYEDDRSETSEREQADYVSDIDSVEDEAKEVYDRYKSLLNEKATLFENFENGNIDIKNFKIRLAYLNNEILTNEFDREETENHIIEKEIQLNGLLSMYEQIINERLPRLKDETTKNPFKREIINRKNVLSDKQIAEMNAIRDQLNGLYDTFQQIDESNDDPIQSNKFYEEWISMAEAEQKHLEQMTGMTYPKRELFKTNEEYTQAQDQFLEDISIFFSSYWEQFEHKEESELLALGKRYNLGYSPPKRLEDQYRSYLSYIRQHLPEGYTVSTGIRKIGTVYEKISTPSFENQIKIMKEFIKFKENEIEEKKNDPAIDPLIKPILIPMMESELLDIKNELYNYKLLLGKIKKEQIMENVEDLSIKLSVDDEKYIDNLKFFNSLFRKLSKEQIIECILKTKSFKPPTPPKKKYSMEPEVVNLRRKSSLSRLIKVFKNVPEGLKRYNNGEMVVDNIKEKAEQLEDKIYKYAINSPYMYIEKVNDIIFLFNTFGQNFQIAFLQGQLNTYQLVLFEKVLRYKNKTYFYPTTIKNRRTALQKIFKEIYLSVYDPSRPLKSDILTKIRIRKRTKELELFIFDISQNEREYRGKIKDLIDFVQRYKSDIFLPIPELLQRIYKPRQQNEEIKENLSYSEVRGLLLNEQYHLKDLQNKKSMLEAKNFVGVNVIFWKPPNIISPNKIKEWNTLLYEFNQRNELSLLNQLNKLHFDLVKSYKLDIIPGINEIRKSIEVSENKIKKLQDLFLQKEIEKQKEIRNKYINSLKEKFTVKRESPYPSLLLQDIRNEYLRKNLPKKSQTYQPINVLLIQEIVSAIRRTFFKEKVELLELYDLNELNNKTTVNYNGKKVKAITENTYNIIKNNLLREAGITDKEILLATKKALQLVGDAIGVKDPIVSPNAFLNKLVSSWKPVWNGEKLQDVYGENVFEKLLYVADPFKFYTINIVRRYNELVKKYTLQPETIYRKPQANIGGKWYNVEFLDVDLSTGQPFFDVVETLGKTSKGTLEVLRTQSAPRHGKFPFVLRQLRTSSVDKTEDVWTRVEQGQVVYRPIQFGKRVKNKIKR